MLFGTRVPPSSDTPFSTSSSGTSYPLTNFVSYDIFSSAHRGFLASITAGVDPRSYSQTLRGRGWFDAMKAEISALEINGTWSLVEIPKDKKALERSLYEAPPGFEQGKAG
ncbi:hypothetical protein LIER_24051 [Lithospermum erythrorhizon]|uniref:Uncharacterized protein n=1 Tax=Lithospermum erythrorhizon TaxID=34254 RepID=A0AAV3R186_LITER